MYQVFVVADELLIRQSIRNAIENMHGPYVLCGEASDGEMALSMMQDQVHRRDLRPARPVVAEYHHRRDAVLLHPAAEHSTFFPREKSTIAAMAAGKTRKCEEINIRKIVKAAEKGRPGAFDRPVMLSPGV